MPLTTSVVLCTFNGARFLAAQWDSLLAQSRLPDEIVVRDDASIDATPSLLDALGRHAEARGVAVHVTRNANNVGYVANFEAALRDARGDVVFPCDQDDVWHLDKFAVLLTAFEQRPELLLMCSNARRVDAQGAPMPRSLFQILKVSSAELRRIHAGAGFGVLLRRSLATGATIALRRSLLADALPFPPHWVHDEWLAIMAAAREGFDISERQLIDYRQHAGNQLGMHERDGVAKLRGVVRPSTVAFDAAFARNRALQDRLHTLTARVPAAYRTAASGQLRHLRARQAVSTAGCFHRLPLVAFELARGGYRNYAAGWHDALRDLLRRR